MNYRQRLAAQRYADIETHKWYLLFVEFLSLLGDDR